ncbi:hypothetical protein [Pseudanabaena mucicola]|nr:hypothetical protein [Pseudanabaena mucicola]
MIASHIKQRSPNDRLSPPKTRLPFPYTKQRSPHSWVYLRLI